MIPDVSRCFVCVCELKMKNQPMKLFAIQSVQSFFSCIAAELLRQQAGGWEAHRPTENRK